MTGHCCWEVGPAKPNKKCYCGGAPTAPRPAPPSPTLLQVSAHPHVTALIRQLLMTREGTELYLRSPAVFCIAQVRLHGPRLTGLGQKYAHGTIVKVLPKIV